MTPGRPGADPLDTFPKLLLHHAAVRPLRPAMRHKDRGIWQTWTWHDFADEALAFADGLRKRGIAPGDTVAVIGANRPRLYGAIIAAQIIGAVPVPVYADAVADEMAHVLENADIVAAVVQDQEQVDKVLSVIGDLPRLKHLLYDEARGLADYDDARLVSVKSTIERAKADFAADPRLVEALRAGIAAGRGDAPSIMLYTSGTTGRSKGVVLSGERCIAAATGTAAFDGLNDRDVQLAYLPLAWVGDHYLNYAQAFATGFCIACPESADTVAQDLREIGPTFYFAPPRVFEQQLTRIMIRMDDASFIKRRLFHYFLGIARRWGEAILDRRRVPFHARLLYGLGDALIYAPLKNILGFSRIRIAYTAGEAIGADLFSFYRSLGLNLKQLYGQTEAFLYVTCHKNGAVRPDTVGPAAPDVTLRISEDGEVQFKSPGQFTTYYKAQEKTAETLTEDGFVKTGDAGFFDPDGQLKIIDRAKDVGKLQDGSLFAPKYIENKLKFFPDIKEAVAFGQGRDFVTVMLNIDLLSLANWAERNNIAYASYQELAGLARVYDKLEKHVEAVNEALSREPVMAGATIRRFLILPKELDADDGELTRTQKVRRLFIAERYTALVQALYDGSYEADIATEITYEDGRKGRLAGRVAIRDVGAPARAPRVDEAA